MFSSILSRDRLSLGKLIEVLSYGSAVGVMGVSSIAIAFYPDQLLGQSGRDLFRRPDNAPMLHCRLLLGLVSISDHADEFSRRYHWSMGEGYS